MSSSELIVAATQYRCRADLRTSAPDTANKSDRINISEDADFANVRWHLDIDKTQLRWESYVKAGYYGVLERFYSPKTSLTGP